MKINFNLISLFFFIIFIIFFTILTLFNLLHSNRFIYNYNH